MSDVRFTVPVARFHTPEAASLLPPIDLLQPVQAELLEVARSVAKERERVSPSRLSSLGGDLGEGGVYLRQGGRDGAVVHVRWIKRAPDVVEVKVSPLSRTQVVLSWTALGGSLALGLLAAGQLGMSSTAALGIGLLLGVSVGVALMLLILKSGLGRSEDSRAMAERLGAAVDAWHAGKPTLPGESGV